MQGQLSAPSDPPVTVLTPLDALAEELGAEAARIERDLRRDFAVSMAEIRQELELVQRRGAEMELRAVTAERALAESVRERLATVRDGDSVTVEDVRPIISGEVARQFDAVPKPLDEAAVEARIAAEVERRLDDIARRAADLVPRSKPVELPDVGALLVDEFAKREDAIAERVATLVKVPELPELPDIDAKVDNAVASAFLTVRVPEDGKSADPAVTADLVRETVGEAMAGLAAAFVNQTEAQDIAERAAALVSPPVPLEPPDIEGTVRSVAEDYLAVPDHLLGLVERVGELVLQPFAVSLEVATEGKALPRRKTIRTRRDDDGNLIAEVTEQLEL